LKDSTRREYLRRLERDLTAILALATTNRHGKRLRKRYLEVRDGLFTFLRDPKLDFADLGRIAGDVYQAVEQPVGIFCTLPVMR
jgi:hypothetical protein